MLNTAIILAGGFGTRLQAVVNDLPKPMAPVNGSPFLNYQLSYLKHYGIKKIIFSVGYLSEKIKDYYGAFFNGLEINYAAETRPLGTGGGIRLAMEQCSEPLALVLNGDSFFEIDLDRFYTLHLEQNAQVSLALRRVANAARYGTLAVNYQHNVTSFKEKNNSPAAGIINGGIYLLDKNLFMAHTMPGENFSIEKDFFEQQLDKLVIKGFEFQEYFIDIGIPEDYSKAQHDFKRFKYQ